MWLTAHLLPEAGMCHLAFILSAGFPDISWALNPLTLTVMNMGWLGNEEEICPETSVFSKVSLFFFFPTNTDYTITGQEAEAFSFLRRLRNECFGLLYSLAHQSVILDNCIVFFAVGVLCHRSSSTTVHFTIHLWNFTKNRERTAGHCAQKLWSSAWSHCQVWKHIYINIFAIRS